MILLLSNAEAGALTLHMSIMRPHFKNLLKSKYRAQKDEYFKSYDYIKSEAQKQLELELPFYEMHLNIIDVRLLNEFLRAYSTKVKGELVKAMQSAKDEQIDILDELQKRCNELIDDVS